MAGAIGVRGTILGRLCAVWHDDAVMWMRFGGVTLQIVRNWVLRFNAEGPYGLISRKVPGKASILNYEQRRTLIEIVGAGPIPASHGIVRWRLIDLAQWARDEFGLSITKQTLSLEMRALGYRKLSARPPHRGGAPSILPLLKNFPARVAQIRKCLPPRTQIELWWQDEARIGQQDQAHPPLGQAEYPALSAQRSAQRFSLDIRCDMSRQRQRGWHRLAPLQQRSDEPAS